MSICKLTEVSDLPRFDNAIVEIDTEGTGLNKMTDYPFMLQIKIHERGQTPHAVGWDKKCTEYLNEELPKTKLVILHNAKFDFHMMRNKGVDADVIYNLKVWDTWVAEALIDEHRYEYGLDLLGKEFFDISKTNDALMDWILTNIPGTNKTKGSPGYWMGYLIHAPREMVAFYGIGDLDITGRLFDRGRSIIERQGLTEVMNLEMDTLKALVEIERRGVRVDQDKIFSTRIEMEERQEILQRELIKLVGYEVNPRSSTQMKEAFELLDLPITYKKPTAAMLKKCPNRVIGNPTFAKEILESHAGNPFIDALLKSRSIKTMLDTFINGQGKFITAAGYIHTDFNQVRADGYGTGTGRLSSSKPNLQQVPKRDGELAPLVRGLFIPDEGHDWISDDWEQFEFRVFAHYVQDEALTARYIADPTTDFHNAASELTGRPRPQAKQINLGLVFGMGEGLLAKECKLPYETYIKKNGYEGYLAGDEAKAIFEEYHSRFPKAKEFLDYADRAAKSRGYVRTITGRRLRFPGGKSTHKAGGLIFQGTSADIMKKKLVILNDTYRKSFVKFNLIVHDEFNLSSPKEITERTAKEVKEITEDVPELSIPILSDVGIGPNWWTACQ